MIRPTAAALILALPLLASPAARAAPQAIEPGYWESTNKLLSPIRQTKVERRCITPAEVDKFMAGPSNRHYTCTYPHKVIAGGRISLKGTCVSKKGRKVAVQGSGAYTPTSFNLTASIATEFLGLDIAGKASTEARRIGDVCPASETPAATN
ncbi:DUF3617 domain-containing protein [Phenylobacterium sp. J426]|uniref:DUF3617 domain-containing protein n=1 Tax=Phenylobacterium sp. J426 TaxID=2898439 RepID=UPI002150CF3A|nr:DUF3617 domain-containing protein [Phenylobacterium sp. J426]MCR5875938.1 DUF3617 domain-containing protein [Phenylobacterium sp. J426]